jgi:hypothetical protein
MAKSLVNPGIPDLPSGLPDKDFGLVAPLYRAISSLAIQVGTLTGAEDYTGTDYATAAPNKFLDIGARGNLLVVTASEALGFGKAVNLVTSGSAITARLATAADLTKPCHGFVSTPQGIASGQRGVITFMTGFNAGVSGTTVGTAYYLSTDGNIQAVSPTADGVINQLVGVGLGIGLMVNIEPIGRRVSYMYKPSAAILRVQYTDGSTVDIAV